MTFNSTLQSGTGYEGVFYKQTVSLPQQTNTTFYGLVYCPYSRKSNTLNQLSFLLSLQSYVLEKKVVLESGSEIESDNKFEFAENYNLDGGAELSIIGYQFLEVTTVTLKSKSFTVLDIVLSYTDTSNSNGYLGWLIRVSQSRLCDKSPQS